MSRERGFTLIELIIVISIMVVLFAIGLPIYSSYTSQRTFTALVEEMHNQARFAYTNSVQGVLGLDKNSSDGESGSNATSDRVSWFLMVDKGTDQYAIGACLPDTRPNSLAACTSDGDYKAKDISSVININFTVPVSPSYAGNVVYVVFTPITGASKIWGTSGAAPLVVDRDFDIQFVAKSDASRSATMKINAQGGIR